MRKAGEIMVARKEEIARIMTREMGKPIGAAVAEAKKCASACRYYAENGESMLARERVAADAADSYVRFDPLGVILAVAAPEDLFPGIRPILFGTSLLGAVVIAEWACSLGSRRHREPRLRTPRDDRPADGRVVGPGVPGIPGIGIPG